MLRLKLIDDAATTFMEDLSWLHFFADFIIWSPNYFRTVADVQFGVDEQLAFLYKCSTHSEEELEQKAGFLLEKSKQGEKLSASQYGAPLMWSLTRPDLAKLTKNQVSKCKDASVRYAREYLKRYVSMEDM